MQRLGKNHNGYLGETIDILTTLAAIKQMAGRRGWRINQFHSAGEIELVALQRAATPTSSSARPLRVYLSTGIHGDEPAGPMAILQMLEQDRWPAGLDITIVPCLNPDGFSVNRRENRDGVDLNRDYLHPKSGEIRAHLHWLQEQTAYDLCLCLHEDWECHGFYLYELNPDQRPSLAAAMIAAVTPVCPIDQSPLIEGRAATGGIIRPDIDPRHRPLWPEAFWLIQHKTRLSYTLESPSDFPLTTRVAALVAATNSALASALLH